MKFLNTLLLICCVAAVVSAGPNSSAIISIDMVHSTVPVDPVFTDSDTGRQFTIAVFASNVVSLNAFSIRLTIDTAKISFLSAALADPSRTNILSGGVAQYGVVNTQTVVELFASTGTAFEASATAGLLGIFVFKSKLQLGDSASISFRDITLSCGNDRGEDLFTAPDSRLAGGIYRVPAIALGTASLIPKNRENHPIRAHMNNSAVSIDLGSCSFGIEQPVLVSLYGIDGRLFVRQSVSPHLSGLKVPLTTRVPVGPLICTLSSGGRVIWSSLVAHSTIQ